MRILDEAVDERRQTVAPLHPRPAVARQIRQPARYGLRPRGDRPERHTAGCRRLSPPDRPPQVELGILERERATGARNDERIARLQTGVGRSPRRGSPTSRLAGKTRRNASNRSASWPQTIEIALHRGKVEAARGQRPDRSSPPPELTSLQPSSQRDSGTRASCRGRRPCCRSRVDSQTDRGGRRRLDGHPSRQDADRRDPDGSEPARQD